MCGRRDYVTENERRQRERADADARMKDEDVWDYPEQDCVCGGHSCNAKKKRKKNKKTIGKDEPK